MLQMPEVEVGQWDYGKVNIEQVLWISLSSLEAAKLLRLDISTGKWKTGALGATRPISISLTRHTCLQKSCCVIPSRDLCSQVISSVGVPLSRRRGQ